LPQRVSNTAQNFHRALRSDADGVARFLPESLIELWLTKKVPIEALPALLKQIEPSLTKSDYKPILRSLRMKIFAIFETICCALLLVISIIAVVATSLPLWLAAMVVLAVACGCWLFLYQVYFGMLLRRKQQIKWLLEHSRMTKTPEPPEPPKPPNPREAVIHSIQQEKPESPNCFRFSALINVPALLEPAMLSRLRKAFPELDWEDQAENWDKVRIGGSTREKPKRDIVYIARKESPGPFKLSIVVSAPDQPEALKSLSQIIDRLQRALSGWSISNLPEFKTRPPSGVDISQQEVIQLMFPLEPPLIRLTGPDADILLSKPLLEALSAQPAGSDDQSRLAGMRGARARIILEKAGPDLQMPLASDRQAQYLVGELLEIGLAQVALHSTPPLSLRRIKVHYFGTRAAPTVGFGHISYSGADAELGYLGEFLRLSWWVS